MSQLEAHNLHVRLGDKQVLAGITAQFVRGQVTAIVGPNGAGKSTLLECLAGLRAPNQGQVTLDDTAVLTLFARQRAQCIGFLPQVPEIAWGVDVRTLVGLGRTPYFGARGLATEDDAAVDRALAHTNTMSLAHRIVTTLSGGERARVLMARVLAGEPQWILADEPLTGLDPGYQLDAADLFGKLAHENNCGILITLHDLQMALRMADRVLVLVDGAIASDGAPRQALSAEILARAYRVEARIIEGECDSVIEIIRRR